MKKFFLTILIFFFFCNCYAQQKFQFGASKFVAGWWGHQRGWCFLNGSLTAHNLPGYAKSNRCRILDTLFQLAPPLIKYHSVFFKTSEIVLMQFAQPETKIFFTLNGKEPSQNDSYYNKPILIRKYFTTLKAKVFGNDFLPSETQAITFIKDGVKIKSIQAPEANEKFPANGPQTLFDNEGGMANNQSKNSLGYQNDSVTINVSPEKKQKITSVLLDFLRDYGSWIFLPQSIRVYYFDGTKKEFRFLTVKEITADSSRQGSTTVFEILNTNEKVFSDKLKIVLTPLQSIPA